MEDIADDFEPENCPECGCECSVTELESPPVFGVCARCQAALLEADQLELVFG